MAQKRKNVIFRRVRGRVIPIRIKKAIKEGPGKIGAGISVGVAGSFLTALLGSREASSGQAIANAKAAQKEFIKKRGFPSRKITGIANKLRIRKSVIKRAKGKFGIALGLVSAGLIGTGVREIARQIDISGKYDDTVGDIVSTLAGGAVLLGSQSKVARKFLAKSHVRISKLTGMTSKLNRGVVTARKTGAFNKRQLSLFLGKGF